MTREDDPGGGPTVQVSNRQTHAVDLDGLAALARETLIAEDVTRGELSVSFVEDAEIAALHARYAGEPGPTDVLAFPLDDRGGGDVHLLGDVVIAPAVAARNNPDDTRGELRLLLVHGILHLLGYGHDDEAERRAMWSRQERYSGVAAP